LNLHSAHKITPRLARFLKNLSNFVESREDQLKQKFRRTRVAIIDNSILGITPRSHYRAGEARGRMNKDNGEDGMSVTSADAKGNAAFPNGHDFTGLRDDQRHEDPRSLWSRIREGHSFVDDGFKICPWLFASDSHGTQMANLICAMDPFCDLYVARVAEGKYGITLERAARVSV
jgi:hypothetical protein